MLIEASNVFGQPENEAVIIERIRRQIQQEQFRITVHAQHEMDEEHYQVGEVLESLVAGKLIENYPEHRRGACCLILGYTRDKRPVHIVCTTEFELLIIITVYEPKVPKWPSPMQRRNL